MNKKAIEQQVQSELEQYFECARKQKCPPSMKQNLYKKVLANKQQSWFPTRMAVAGLSLVFISSVVFKISNNHNMQQDELAQARIELQVAMHYMNQVSLKSLTAVNNKGIKPGLIKPLARSVATL